MESKKCFPDLMIGMIRAGEGSGNLDQVTERLTLQYEKDYKLTQQVKSAMTYPVVLLVLCVAIVILIVTFILPQFQSLFDQMDSLPVPTEILIAISDFLVQKWYAALLIVFTVFMLIRIIMAIPAVRRQIDYRKVHMPVFGKLFKIIYTARFARTLSSLYSSGMPIATALGIAGNTIGNSYVEGQFEQVVALVRSGIPMSQALREVDGLQKKLASTILVGEESGRLDVMLDSIALSLEADAEEATKRMVTLMEPLLIMMMAVVVGFIMIAVMLPIYESYSAIENS
jgi:type IV pilus assembly protein PilC